MREWLQGVRVLDLSRYLPGPLATLMLADMGAEVLKIEAPGGDEVLALGPRGPGGEPIYYDAVNGGKRVRRMDLKDAGERAAFMDLVRAADVLVESSRPGVMARLGLDYATLSAAHPGLIYCSLSGYGVESPHVDDAGHDINYLARAGVLFRNGAMRASFDPPVADTSGSLFAALAIVGALRARDRDGRGCHIDIGLADVAAPLQSFQIGDFGARGADPGPAQTYLSGGAACYQVYATAEGRHVAVGALEAKFWTRFCTVAERPEWIARQHEPLPQRALIAEVGGYLARLTLAQCEARFGAADCCVTPVLGIAESIDSAHARGRRLVVRGPGGDLQALFPAWVDGAPPLPRAPVQRAERQALAPTPGTAHQEAP